MKPDPGQLKMEEKVSFLVNTRSHHMDNNSKQIDAEYKKKSDYISYTSVKELDCGKSSQLRAKSTVLDPALSLGSGSTQHASSTLACQMLTMDNSTIKAVLAENIKGSVVLADVLVLHVKDKRLISKAVQNLSICRPVAELHHLKRVNRVKMDEEKCSQGSGRASETARDTVVKEGRMDEEKCSQGPGGASENARDMVDEEKCSQGPGAARETAMDTVGKEGRMNCRDGVSEDTPCQNDHKVQGKKNSVKKGENGKEKRACLNDMVLVYVDLIESLITVEEVLHIVGENCSSMLTLGKTITEAECFSESTNFKNLFSVNNSKVSEILKNKLHSIKLDMSLFSDVLYISKVSRHPPRLRHLFNVATEYWPCTFHEDAYLTKMLTGDVFDEQEKKQVMANMNMALFLASKCSLEARSSNGHANCALLTPTTSADGVSGSGKQNTHQHVQECSEISLNINSQTKISLASSGMDGLSSTFLDNNQIGKVSRSSCIFFDSFRNRVIAEAIDSRHSHPLAHAAMVAVDLVGHSLGGGAWQIDAEGVVSPKEKGMTSVQTTENIYKVNSSEEECSDTIKENSNTTNQQSGDVGREITLSTGHQSKPLSVTCSFVNTSTSASCNLATTTSAESSNNVSYICTGLDAYLSHEPCMMCAMALLHSRVRRVFYCLPNAAKGALGSVVRLHTMQGINHRYEVFKLLGEYQDDEEAAPKSSAKSQSFWSFEYYQQYFDVDSKQVGDRIMWSMVPKPGVNYLEVHIRPKPDLYGPFWVCLTLVFAAAIAGNVSNYLQTKGDQSQHWRYDFHKVSLAAGMVFSYGWLLPLLIWSGLRYKSSKPSLSLLDLTCLYGYSLSVLVPVCLVWTAPIVWLRWCVGIVGVVLSGVVLAKAVWEGLKGGGEGGDFVEETGDDSGAATEGGLMKKVAMAVVVIVIVMHVAIAMGFMLYFFNEPAGGGGPMLGVAPLAVTGGPQGPALPGDANARPTALPAAATKDIVPTKRDLTRASGLNQGGGGVGGPSNVGNTKKPEKVPVPEAVKQLKGLESAPASPDVPASRAVETGSKVVVAGGVDTKEAVSGGSSASDKKAAAPLKTNKSDDEVLKKAKVSVGKAEGPKNLPSQAKVDAANTIAGVDREAAVVNESQVSAKPAVSADKEGRQIRSLHRKLGRTIT